MFVCTQKVIYGFSIHKNVGREALRRNQHQFGNQPKAMKMIGRAKVPVEYTGATLS